MRRAPGDVKIDGENRVQPLGRLRAICKNASGNRASADGNHDLGIRHSFVSFQKRLSHITRNRTRDNKPVGMTGRGHKLDTKTTQIKNGRVKDINVRLTSIATPGRDLPKFERPAKHLRDFFIQGIRERVHIALENEIFTLRYCHPKIVGVSNAAIRDISYFPEIHAVFLSRDDGPASIARRQDGKLPLWKRQGPASLSETCH